MTRLTFGLPDSRSELVIAFCLAVVLAVATFVQFSVVSRTQVDNPLAADAREYFFSAYNLRHFGVYSSQITYPSAPGADAPPADAARSPGYPLFLAANGEVEPTDAFVGRVVSAQATLGVLSVFLLYLISRQFVGTPLALVAALLAAISPHLAVMSSYILTETLFTFCLFCAVLASQVAVKRGTLLGFACAGAMWGLAALVRPTVVLFPVMGALIIVALPRIKHPRLPVLVGVAAFALTLSPWMLRNAFSNKIPSQSLMVNFVLHGSYPGFMYKDNPGTYGDPYRLDPNAVDAGKSLPATLEYLRERAVDDPVRYASWYLLGKPGFFLSWSNIDGVGDIFVYSVSRSPYLEDRTFDRMRQAMYLIHWPLMLLGFAGMLLVLWQRASATLAPTAKASAIVVAIVFLYAVAVHMIGAPYPRYGIPFRPLLFPFALLALRLAWSHVTRITSR